MKYELKIYTIVEAETEDEALIRYEVIRTLIESGVGKDTYLDSVLPEEYLD